MVNVSPTDALDMEALRRCQCAPGPSVSQDLEVNFFALDQQDMFIDPAQKEDLRQGSGQRLVPKVLHVDGFEISENLVTYVVLLLEVNGEHGPWGHRGQ